MEPPLFQSRQTMSGCNQFRVGNHAQVAEPPVFDDLYLHVLHHLDRRR